MNEEDELLEDVGEEEESEEEEFEVERPPLGPIPLETIDGRRTTMAEFEGKVLLVVNTAGNCEFSDQYDGLQRIYDRYKDRGFVVLAFPSDNFKKEPDDNAVIAGKLKTRGVTYPVFAKTPVKGKDKHPLFQWLTDRSIQPEWGSKVTWNFNKFLIGRSGEVLGRFVPGEAPEDEIVVDAIEEALEGP
jgi:glutathione peroxidase